jgi:hypothetical protein
MFYVEAFQELSTCRSGGFGLSAIPFVAIVEYAKLYEIEGDDFHEFLDIIRRMDSELLKLENAKQKSDSKKGPKNGGNTSTGNQGRNRHPRR